MGNRYFLAIVIVFEEIFFQIFCKFSIRLLIFPSFPHFYWYILIYSHNLITQFGQYHLQHLFVKLIWSPAITVKGKANKEASTQDGEEQEVFFVEKSVHSNYLFQGLINLY